MKLSCGGRLDGSEMLSSEMNGFKRLRSGFEECVFGEITFMAWEELETGKMPVLRVRDEKRSARSKYMAAVLRSYELR